MSEETRPAEAGQDAETAVVPDAARTEAAALAWSVEDAAPELDEEPAAERRPLPRPLVGLLAAVCLGALALAAFVVGQHHGPGRASGPATTAASSPATPAPPSSPSPPAVAAPPPAPAPAPSSPTPAPARSGPDAKFLAYIRDYGVPYRSGDADAIASAHEVCRALATRTPAEEAGTVQRAVGWTYEQSASFVAGAVGYYCPQYAPPA